jgi:hypothetical protein
MDTTETTETTETTKTVRYAFNGISNHYLWDSSDFSSKKMKVPNCFSGYIFANILEQTKTAVKLKLFLPNGECMEGWCLKFNNPICIFNMEALFDGRFNQ